MSYEIDAEGEYIDSEDCVTWVKYTLDGFVIIKAVVLIIISMTAIRWYSKSEMQSVAVITALLVSCAVVGFELAFRYSERRTLHRFLLNAFSQWLVFWCMTIMLSFARWNDAA